MAHFVEQVVCACQRELSRGSGDERVVRGDVGFDSGFSHPVCDGVSFVDSEEAGVAVDQGVVGDDVGENA